MNNLDGLAKQIEDLHAAVLFGDPIDERGLDPLAELEFMTAAQLLALAAIAMRKADMHQTRALAASPYRQ